MALAVLVKTLGPTSTKGNRLKVQRADHDSSKGDIALTYSQYMLHTAMDAPFRGRGAVTIEDIAFLRWADSVFTSSAGQAHGSTGLWARGSMGNDLDVYVKIQSSSEPARLVG